MHQGKQMIHTMGPSFQRSSDTLAASLCWKEPRFILERESNLLKDPSEVKETSRAASQAMFSAWCCRALLNQNSALDKARYMIEDLDCANQDVEVKISRNQDFWSVLLPLENIFSLCAVLAFLIKYRSCLHAHKPPGEEKHH